MILATISLALDSWEETASQMESVEPEADRSEPPCQHEEIHSTSPY